MESSLLDGALPLPARDQPRPRIDLEKAHPLPFPLSIWIEPTNVCNFKCGFCPESLPDYAAQAGYHQHMPIALWEKIARDLPELGRPGVLRFFHEGEPLLNPQLPRMISDAKPLTDRTEVFTNGSLLIDRAQALVASGLTALRVSVYGVTAEGFKSATGVSRWTPASVIAGVRAVHQARGGRQYPSIQAKLMLPNPTREEMALFREQYEGITDQIDQMESLHNWGGSVVRIGEPPRLRKVCPMPFYTLAIKANGAVSVCCADWRNELVVGDIARQTLKEIWEGSALKAIQEAHWSGNRSALATCRTCTSFLDYPDNLDRHLDADAVR